MTHEFWLAFTLEVFAPDKHHVGASRITSLSTSPGFGEMSPFAKSLGDAPIHCALPPSQICHLGRLWARGTGYHRSTKAALVEPSLTFHVARAHGRSSVLTLPDHQQLWIQWLLPDSPFSLGFQDTTLCCLTVPPPQVPWLLPSVFSEYP